MLAIIQHNLKRLLAYHSIENIGIIGIGIGLGCIGIGKGNHLLTVLGFAGALLHTLNHSLFKSLLFYGAGNVYQSTHTIDIEKLGGIGKQMPHTCFFISYCCTWLFADCLLLMDLFRSFLFTMECSPACMVRTKLFFH